MPAITTDIIRPWGKPPFREVFAYWNSVRGTDLVPRRSDFKPEKLGSILNEIAILERVEDTYIFRLYSAGLRERVQADATGLSVVDFLVGESQIIGRQILGTVLDHPAAAFAQLKNFFSDKEDGTPSKSVIIDSFYLPMKASDGNTTLMLALYHLATPEHQRLANAKVYGGTEILEGYFYDIGAGVPPQLSMTNADADG